MLSTGLRIWLAFEAVDMRVSFDGLARRHVRPRYCCRICQSLHVAAMPAQPIDKGIPAPGLITRVATGNYLNHLPPVSPGG